jgi:hypothetical protein
LVTASGITIIKPIPLAAFMRTSSDLHQVDVLGLAFSNFVTEQDMRGKGKAY